MAAGPSLDFASLLSFLLVLVVAITMEATFLVLLGLVCSMILIRKEQWFWAGASLILTTVKPHMALLAVPYLLLYISYRRKWQGWLGLLSRSYLPQSH